MYSALPFNRLTFSSPLLLTGSFLITRICFSLFFLTAQSRLIRAAGAICIYFSEMACEFPTLSREPEV